MPVEHGIRPTMTLRSAPDTIAGLGAEFRAGTLDPVRVTESCLERIAANDGALNAMVTVTGDRARAAAERAGRELREGVDRGPLHGVPVVVKDLIDVAGVPTGYGSAPAFRIVPSRHAALVQRIETAGGVILGKANLLEFAYGAVNPLVGQTNNPHDPSRTAGGSSGGSAAAVASAMAFAGVGTDTGGSIRVPAAYCGIVGHKPTFGLVPLEGVFPLSWTLDHAGPIARTSACALAFLDALAGTTGPSTPISVAGRRFGVIRGHIDDRSIHADVRAAFEGACDMLVDAGASLVDVRVPELEGMAETVLDILLPEAALIHASRLAQHPEAYAPQTRAQIEAGPGVGAMSYLRALEHRRRLTLAMEEAMAGVDALVAPAVPWVAPAEDPAVDADEGYAEMHCTGPANLTGLPSVTIYGGPGEGGLPTGFMLTGPRGGDRRLLRVCMGIESVLPPAPRPALRGAP
jgi:aspartyl-tRNA(Asn)/glutamyl-tRNA(Gln) amidotransferase subunit A